MNGHKILRILGWTVLGGFATLLLVLTAVFFTLRSPGMQQQILTGIREPLQAAGIDPTLDRLSIDIFGGVELEGLTLRIDRAPLAKGLITLRRLRLRYSFLALLQKELQVAELTLDGVDGDLELELPLATEEPPELSAGLQPLIDLLRNPPVRLDSPVVALEDISVRVKGKRGALGFQFELKKLGLEASVGLSPGRLEAKLQGDIPVRFLVSQALPEGGERQASGQLRLGLDPALQVELAGSDLKWQADWQKLAVDLQDFKLEQPALRLAFAHVRFEQALALSHSGPFGEPAQLAELLWPLQVKGEHKLSSSPLRLDQGGEKGLNLEVGLELKQALSFTLATPEAWRALDWDFDQNLVLKPLQIRQNTSLLLWAHDWSWQMTGSGRKGKGQFQSRLEGDGQRSDLFQTELNLQKQLQLGLDLPQQSLDLNLKTTLNDLELLSLQLAVQDPQDRQLAARLLMTLNTGPALKPIHNGLAQLEALGYPQITLEQDLAVQHPSPLAQITGDHLGELTITNKMNLKLRQSVSKEPLLLRFKALALDAQSRFEKGSYEATFGIDAEGVRHAALLRAVDLQQKLSMKGTYEPRLTLDIQGQTMLDRQPLLELQAQLKDKPRLLQLLSSLRLEIEPRLQTYLKGLTILKDTGPLTIESQQTIQMRHEQERAAEVKSWALPSLEIDAQLSQVLRSADRTAQTYRVLEPVKVDTRLLLSKAKLDLTTRILAPRLEAQNLARVDQLKVGIKAAVDSVETQGRVDVKTVVEAAAVTPMGKLAERPELKDLLKRMQLIVHARVRNKNSLEIEKLYAGIQHPMVQFRGQGRFALAGQGNFQSQLDVDMPATGPVRGKGRFRLPLQLTIYDKKKVSLKAEPTFQQFSIDLGDISLKNVQGSLQVHEELGIDEQGRVGFLFLDTQNPFVRVDYETVEPYVGDPSLLSIDEIRWRHVTVGPLVQNLELRQNLVRLNDLKADLLGGSILGRFYFDLHPSRLQFGFLGRFSNLQAERLKTPERQRNSQRDAVLSGRIGSSFDLRQRLATGRIDITAMGRSQLLSLLDLIDPDYQDSQIQIARRALQVAYPRLVAIAMGQGLMDLTIGLGGAISQDINIRSIPLTPLINAQLGEVLLKVENVIQTEEEKP